MYLFFGYSHWYFSNILVVGRGLFVSYPWQNNYRNWEWVLEALTAMWHITPDHNHFLEIHFYCIWQNYWFIMCWKIRKQKEKLGLLKRKFEKHFSQLLCSCSRRCPHASTIYCCSASVGGIVSRSILRQRMGGWQVDISFRHCCFRL